MTDRSQTNALTRRITDHEATSRHMRREQAQLTRAMLGAVKSAVARIFRAAARHLSAGSAAYR